MKVREKGSTHDQGNKTKQLKNSFSESESASTNNFYLVIIFTNLAGSKQNTVNRNK